MYTPLYFTINGDLVYGYSLGIVKHSACIDAKSKIGTPYTNKNNKKISCNVCLSDMEMIIQLNSRDFEEHLWFKFSGLLQLWVCKICNIGRYRIISIFDLNICGIVDSNKVDNILINCLPDKMPVVELIVNGYEKNRSLLLRMVGENELEIYIEGDQLILYSNFR